MNIKTSKHAEMLHEYIMEHYFNDDRYKSYEQMISTLLIDVYGFVNNQQVFFAALGLMHKGILAQLKKEAEIVEELARHYKEDFNNERN